MHRIDHATRQVNGNGSGKDGFTGGDVSAQVARTVVTPDWLNAVQEEIANSVVDAALNLSKPNNSQLAKAIRLRAVGPAEALAVDMAPTITMPGQANSAASDSLNNLIVVGDFATVIRRSSNGGVSFSNETQGGSANTQLFGIDYSPSLDRFVAVGQNGNIQRSGAGAFHLWNQETPATPSVFLTGVLRSEALGLWIAYGSSGEIETSSDGASWTKRTPGGGSTSAFYGAVEVGGAILLGGDGEIQRSTNGTTWTRIALTHPFAGGWSPVIDANGTVIASGSSHYALSSDAGATWGAAVANDGTPGAISPWSGLMYYGGGAVSRTLAGPRTGIMWGGGSYQFLRNGRVFLGGNVPRLSAHVVSV